MPRLINLSLFSYLHKKHEVSQTAQWNCIDQALNLLPFPLQGIHRTKTGVERVCVTAQDAVIVVDQMSFFGVCAPYSG